MRCVIVAQCLLPLFFSPVSLDAQNRERDSTRAEIEYLPLFSYDTDVGFGIGAKAFFLDQLSGRESFDLVLLGSTKGERWYRLVVSVPDFELRQGTGYPLAVDITVDYDKYLNNGFFGVGPDSRFEDRETYTREPLDCSIIVGSALNTQTVVEGGVRYQWIRNRILSAESAVAALSNSLSFGTATALSLTGSYRIDTRNSFIRPSHGYVIRGDLKYAPRVGNVSFLYLGLVGQYYETVLSPTIVIACRLVAQTLEGDEVPLQFLLPVGGTRTLRGFPQDRFVDRTSCVLNLETRFPVFWRFGGVLGMDAGHVWSSPLMISMAGWQGNAVAGLRFYMDTFIVRADFGFSAETTGFYLNFGHLF